MLPLLCRRCSMIRIWCRLRDWSRCSASPAPRAGSRCTCPRPGSGRPRSIAYSSPRTRRHHPRPADHRRDRGTTENEVDDRDATPGTHPYPPPIRPSRSRRPRPPKIHRWIEAQRPATATPLTGHGTPRDARSEPTRTPPRRSAADPRPNGQAGRAPTTATVADQPAHLARAGNTTGPARRDQ